MSNQRKKGVQSRRDFIKPNIIAERKSNKNYKRAKNEASIYDDSLDIFAGCAKIKLR